MAFQAETARKPHVTPARNGASPLNTGSSATARVSSIIACTVSSLVRPPALGLSP